MISEVIPREFLCNGRKMHDFATETYESSLHMNMESMKEKMKGCSGSKDERVVWDYYFVLEFKA